jgi:pyruvate dehydrogenase E2 component (dihydrolipoamide acetyltransferase)
MRISVLMPKLDYDMKSGRIVAWRRNVGDTVRRGEILLEVEGDKAIVDIEAASTGTLTEIIYDAGTEVPVGVEIALITTSGDEASDS